MTVSVLLILLASLALATGDQWLGICCLCEGCGLVTSGRGGLKVTSDGGTCNKMSLDLPDLADPGSAKCIDLQARYRPSCCDPNYKPSVVAQEPTPSPRTNFPPGTEPACDLCVGGSYPKRPNTVTAVLYMPGNPTCGELYWMGLNGNIPDRLCNSLVDYMEVPCGCERSSDVSKPVSIPIRKTPPRDTKKKLYMGRIRGNTRLLRGLGRAEKREPAAGKSLPVSR